MAENGEDIGARLLDYRQGAITPWQSLMPARQTRDERGFAKTACAI